MALRGRGPGWLSVGAFVVVGAVFGPALPAASRSATPPVQAAPPRVVQALEIGGAASSPVGLAVAPRGTFYVVTRRAANRRAASRQAANRRAAIRVARFSFTARKPRVDTRSVAAVARPIDVTYDPTRRRLLFLTHGGSFAEAQLTRTGAVRPRTLRRDGRRVRVVDPRGLAVDPERGTVYVLDASGPALVRVKPSAAGGLGRGAAVSRVPLPIDPATHVAGLAFDPSTGHLHLRAGHSLYELTVDGALVATRDLSTLALRGPQGMVFAPSGDQTDDPAETSLYVVDRTPAANRGSGRIVELSLQPTVATPAIDVTSTLVHTIDTAAWSPPSPDPSGIAYLPRGRLIEVDGEVEETINGITHFRGANVWEFSRSGSVLRTANISKVAPTHASITNEPTDIAFDAARGRYFLSDDSDKAVFTVNPGRDRLLGTGDDTWTVFHTNVPPNHDDDAEGICYDSADDRLFVADGVNAEIYEYTRTGTLVTHFDVERYGVLNPEGVEYDAATGTLLVLSDRQSGPIVVETTTTGTLLQTIRLSQYWKQGGRKPAGLTIAPASNGSGASSLYIVDREVDNNNHPEEVDGKIFEYTAPSSLLGGSNGG